MVQIYRCRLVLQEPTFFSTREISNLYQTEAFIGHIALAYALGLAPSRYYNDGKTIYYQQDLAALNQAGVYLTPATITNAAKFSLGQFNAQAESYWFAMGNNAIITAPEGTWAERNGSSWYIHDGVSTPKKVRVENRPQFGRIRALAIGTTAEFYAISQRELQLPSYLRLGKWMSKAFLQSQPVTILAESAGGSIPFLLAGADLSPACRLLAFDVLHVPPTPLIRNSHVQGPCYELDDGKLLPQGMAFNLEAFK
ncbi:type I-D CRISPR-associated protein Cas5/Csc1 [Herpetosiphon sp. NSE202]|uniref:type I-D CRISPR-associated protein Cas5/Csc1 n=1 Tax=Herpetosiphon sp. NSE202 TaxID=3351349 RepID=UPI0036436B90